MSKKTIILYGVGQNAVNALRKAKNIEWGTPVCFCDSSTEKQGGIFENYQILSLSECLEKYPFAYYYVTCHESNKILINEITINILQTGRVNANRIFDNNTFDYFDRFQVDKLENKDFFCNRTGIESIDNSVIVYLENDNYVEKAYKLLDNGSANYTQFPYIPGKMCCFASRFTKGIIGNYEMLLIKQAVETYPDAHIYIYNDEADRGNSIDRLIIEQNVEKEKILGSENERFLTRNEVFQKGLKRLDFKKLFDNSNKQYILWGLTSITQFIVDNYNDQNLIAIADDAFWGEYCGIDIISFNDISKFPDCEIFICDFFSVAIMQKKLIRNGIKVHPFFELGGLSNA